MGSVRFKASEPGARALLRSPGALEVVRSHADRCAAACNAEASEDGMDNDPFSSAASLGRERAGATVFTRTPHGINHNAKYDTILRNL